MMKIINVARDFTPYPTGRTIDSGSGNGTEFREEFLLPVMKKGECAKVILDDVYGYPVSFLEEAFGGLVQKEGYSPEEVIDTFTLVAEKNGFSRLIMLIEEIIREAGMDSKYGRAKQ